MLDRLLTRTAHVAVHRARLILALAVVALIAAGAYGFTVFGKLGSEGFEDPGSESAKAQRLLDGRGIHDPDIVLVVSAKDGRSVDDPDVAAAGLAVTQKLIDLGPVADVGSYWSLGKPDALRSDDGTRAMLVASTDAAASGERIDDSEVYTMLTRQIVGEQGLIDVQLGGFLAINQELNTQISGDLARAESFAIPITLILLVLVFGSLVAASLPLLIGIVSIIGSFAALSVIADLTDVSVFSINLVTGLGMGLGIDYALLIVNRYREELHGGASKEEAITTTVRRTGRTIVFSGLTVALALAAMMVFPLYFLRSFAYSGIAVVLLAIVGAIIVLPAMLMVLGKRIDSVTILKRSVRPPEEGFFSRLAQRIMHRPVAIAVAVGVTAVLVVLGTPFLHAEWGNVDDRALPEGAASRQAQALVREDFSAQEASIMS
ncbi:MAG: Integral rane protein, partial [Pseudonocardiales bacterium]|nr:Integral rane protein [Pseudonocardiales bacterium]